MPEVPVKIEHNGSWVVTRLTIDADHIVITTPCALDIPHKSVTDIEEKKSVLTISFKGAAEQKVRVASVERVLQVIKKTIIVSCNAYRLMAYFMSPAIRGGVMVTTATWEKGAVAVLKSGLWLVSQDKQICVPFTEIADLELTQRDVQGVPTDVIKFDHLDANEVITSFVSCPISTLQVLYNFIRDATKGMDMKGDELDPVAGQVAMLVYSGMDSHAIESMLSLPQKKLDEVIDKLLQLGIAEVVCVRREVQLTPKGVRYISDSLKTKNK